MSPHTDPGALLKLADRLRNFAVWNARQSHYEPVPLCREAAEAIESITRQAASQGREGGELLDVIYKRAWDAYVEFSMAPDHTTFDCIRAVVDAALSPPVKTAAPADISIHPKSALDGFVVGGPVKTGGGEQSEVQSESIRTATLWFEQQIENAKQDQISGFRVGPQVRGERAHARQCALYEAKQVFLEAVRTLNAAQAQQVWPKEIRSLVNEIAGVWDAFEIGLRQEISNTNYAVVREKLSAVESLIASSVPSAQSNTPSTGE